MVRTSFALFSLLLLAACSGGGGSAPAPTPPVTVSLNPGGAALAPGGTAQFSASVANASNPAVTWSVQEGASGGTITGSGLYTAPATIPGPTATFHVTATSVADTSKSAQALVTVTAPVGVSLTPVAAAVGLGGTQQFTATVSNSTNPAVTWSIQEGATGGSVSATGLYTAPASIGGSSAVFHVIATSVAEPSKSAQALVTVALPQPLITSFTATPATISAGQTSTLAWAVSNASGLSINQGVGAVSGSSVAVSPLQSTTYTLTASNGAGSVNQSVTVTVQGLQGNLALLAGNMGGPGTADGPSSAARLQTPADLVWDPAGNAYVVDNGNYAVRKVAPDGTVSTVAGRLGEQGTEDGPLGTSLLRKASRIARDGAGNLFISDQNAIRKITPDGTVSTFAGNITGFGTTDGTGTAARFRTPRGLAVDGVGNLFVADSESHTIRKITPAGEVSTLAGSPGQSGSADGAGASARFSTPRGVAVNAAGELLVTDGGNHTIRKVTPGGVVTTVAGAPGQSGSTDGAGAVARFSNLQGIAVDPAGNAFVIGSGALRMVTPTGTVSTVIRQSDIHDFFALGWEGVALDPAGIPHVAEYYGHAVRRLPPGGSPSVLAGVPLDPGHVNASGGAARFSEPSGMALDANGDVIVAQDPLRRVSPSGAVTDVAPISGTQFSKSTGVTRDASGTLYWVNFQGHTLYKLVPGGTPMLLAGGDGQSGSTDGTGNAARFNSPRNLAVDAAGNLYVADLGNHTIRRITPAGVVTTLAGSAGQSGGTDGVGAAARFYYPYGIALDGAGNLYVTERDAHRIRRIAPDGTVTTVAGSGSAGSADGLGSAATFRNPKGITWESASSTLLVADSGNHTIRRVTPAGVVSTVLGKAGEGTVLLGALPGRLAFPDGILAGPGGKLWISLQNGVVVLNP